MPIEHKPQKPLPLNHIPAGGRPHQVKTNETLVSIARTYGISEAKLLTFNFGTSDPREVNWYLRNLEHLKGCTKATHDGKNWMFITDARPGKGTIYLPPLGQGPQPPVSDQTKRSNVASMSNTDRLAEILQRSKKNFGPDVGAAIDSLLSPANLAIMAGTLVVWVGSHFFGVGEIVDVLLLVVGAFAIGWSITDVAKDLYTFGDLTINARSEDDLEKAAQAFSHAIVLAGITVIMAVLLRRSVKEIQVSRGANVMDAMRPRSPGTILERNGGSAIVQGKNGIRIRLDEAKLKNLAIKKWLTEGRNRLVKVVSRERGASQEVGGYITQEKYIMGRTPAEMERLLGLPAGELKNGANVMRLNRPPNAAEFELSGYTNTPGGVPYKPGDPFPPGLGVPQWRISRGIQVPSTPVKFVRPGQAY